jgi:hypothetical protein
MDELEHERFIAAMCESEVAVSDGEVQDLDEAFAAIRSELGLTGDTAKPQVEQKVSEFNAL